MAEEYRKYSIPHPEWVDFPNKLPPNTRIERMTRARKDIVSDPALDITELTIKARDGYDIRLRSYRRTAASKLPLFLYMHGGGFVTGSLETDDKTCRAVAKEVELCILSIEYRLAPEHPFPVGFEDCWDVLQHITTSPAISNLDLDLESGFLVGGTSAGANFTAGLAHRYHVQAVKGKPKITDLVFWAGSWCHPDVRPEHLRPSILSVDEIDDAPGLTKSSIEYFWKKYGAPKDDKRYSPLLEEEWKGVASKAYFAICGWDPRRDEAIVFADILRNAGLDVKDQVYQGLPHGFWTTCPELPVSVEWEKETVAGIKWMLEKGE
ncbi:alpha/beta-hydrolase [Cucurbitaria berberidis CBS 394.84]|uniref:Alpha/beta-hydrolase n=1 Tax=Cucurbitaria berberidis CBS 394.84 TaxID=1168544 RepID=A0A9P4GHE1_9PLEO|nr:alpha/beta-hydrolase [Cucurbitaria berberidis CBS 394.84]KAF1846183.1 alpha/beta-hydrolase [Cucurbitaria berberidis CBS 394.84]